MEMKLVHLAVSQCILKTQERSDVESECDEESTELPPPIFHNLPEAIACLEDICYFLECRGYTPQSTETMSLMSSLTTLHFQNLSKCSRQFSLLEVFTS